MLGNAPGHDWFAQATNSDAAEHYWLTCLKALDSSAFCPWRSPLSLLPIPPNIPCGKMVYILTFTAPCWGTISRTTAPRTPTIGQRICIHYLLQFRYMDINVHCLLPFSLGILKPSSLSYSVGKRFWFFFNLYVCVHFSFVACFFCTQ